MLRVPLSNSEEFALIDNRFLHLLCLYTWSIGKKGYPTARVKGKMKCLHQVIAEEVGMVGRIDHKDQNKLNNLLSNLRPATRSQNSMNRGAQSDSQTGVKGVTWRDDLKRYYARCSRKYLGIFRTLKEASDAYDEEAKRVHGDFAFLNNYQESEVSLAL